MFIFKSTSSLALPSELLKALKLPGVNKMLTYFSQHCFGGKGGLPSNILEISDYYVELSVVYHLVRRGRVNYLRYSL